MTYAAHYPVGYPALLAVAYAIAGHSAGVAMVVNAVVGALAAWGAHAMVDGEGVPRWRPLAAGLVVALHPALVPYTPAVMTEGVTAALLVFAAGLAARARQAAGPLPRRDGGAAAWRRAWSWIAALGLTLGIAVLVRPQSLVLAPVLGALALPAGSGVRARVARGLAVTLLALAVVAPWTARNCVRMGRCSMVSVNGGWNLLIGVTTATGAWAPVQVPPECATVWDEAGKDACFEAAALRGIAASPLAWAERAPGKLAATFDYFGAAPWYLHASNPDALGDSGKWWLGAVETVACRLLLLASLAAVAPLTGLAGDVRRRRRPSSSSLLRGVVTLLGALAAVMQHAWIAYLALAVGLALLGRRTLSLAPLVAPATLAVLAATASVHAVFFGAGRYGLVVAPFVAALAFVRFDRATPVPPDASASRASSASSSSPSLPAAARS